MLIEAETIIASGFVVENHGVTSQGQVASLLNSGNSQGELAYTFEAGAGTYDLSIIAHDENDGVSTVEVLVDGVLVETFTLDGDFPSGAIADNNRVSLDVTGLNLAPGAEVVVRAQQGGGEWVRIDTLEFTPVGPPPEPAPPTGDLADVNVALDAPFIIDLDEHFSDINGDALTYQISGPGAAYAQLDGSTLTINASVEGDFGLTVIANDGTFDSAPVAFTFSATETPPEPISIEAETIIASGFVVENHGATSQGQVASLLNSGNSQGELSYTFEGGASAYDLSIIAHDENDGVSTVEVLVDGVLVETFTLDGDFPSGAIADNNRVSLDVTGLNLAPGAVITIRAQQGQGEWVRIDKLEFTPVGPINEAPVGTPSPAIAATEDVVTTFNEAELLANFTDPEGDAMTVDTLSTDVGQLAPIGNGDWTLTAPADFNGQITLTYGVSDGQGNVTPASRIVEVAAVNDAPTTSPVDAGAAYDDAAPVPINLLDGASDAENDVLSAINITVLDDLGASAAFTDNGDGTITIDPTQYAGLAADQSRTLTISYDVFDGTDATANTATLEIDAAAGINRAPVGTPAPAIAASEDLVTTISEADLLANFTDPDGDAMTVESLATDIGQLTPIGNGDWALTTPANFNGPVTLTYGVSDGQGNVTPTSRTVDVAAVNDAPTGALGDVDVTVDTPLVIDLDAAFSDVESDALTYQISGPGAAYASLDGATLTINPTVEGAFDITVIANDGTDDSAPVTFTVSATEIPVDTVPSVVLFADELNLTIGARPFETGAGTTTGLSQDGEPALGEASFGVTPAAYQEAGIRYGRAIDEKTGVLHLDIYRPEGSGGDLAIRYSVTNDDGTTSNFTIRLRDDNYGLWTVEGVDTPVRLRDLPADQWHHVTADLTALIGDGATLSSIAVRGDGDGGDTYYLDNVQLTETTAYSEPVHTEIFVSPLWSSAPGAFIRPESAQYDPVTGYVFVSEALPDGQGKVMLLDTDGNIVDPDWLTGLTWPKGLIIENGLVYVATDKDLVVANAATGEVVATYTADAGASLNDVTMAADGSVYVSDLNQAAIWRLKDGVFEMFVSDPTLVSANGIRINDDKLWLATFDQGVLYEIDLETKAISQVLDGVQAFDGVIEIEPGIWLMSSFNGQIRMYNEEDGSLTSIYSNLFNHNAADIGYDPASQTIFVPTFSPQGVFALQLHFPEGAGTPTPVPSDPIEVEAETIIASGFIVEGQGVASNDEVASLFRSGATEGELSYTFAGGAATYDLSVIAHDETDGVSTVEVLVNGEVVETFTLDASLGSNSVADNNRVSLDVAGLALEAGDEVVIRAQQGGGEWVRVDKLVFTPVGGAPTPAPPEANDDVLTPMRFEQEAKPQLDIASLSDGRYVFVWPSRVDPQDSSKGYEAKGQIYNADGSPSGYEFTIGGSKYYGVNVVGLSDGGFAVAWTDPISTTQSRIFVQTFNSDGSTESAKMIISSSGSYIDYSIAPLLDGKFVVTWDTPYEIAVKIYNSDGSTASPIQIVDLPDGGYTDTSGPRVAALPDGGFVVLWDAERPSIDPNGNLNYYYPDRSIDGRIFDADGNPTENTIGGSMDARDSVLEGLDDGGFVLATPRSSGVLVNIYDSEGDLEFGNGVFLGGSHKTSDINITKLANGGIVVSWTEEDHQQGDNTYSAVVAQVIGSDGVPLSSKIIIDDQELSDQVEPTLTGLADGGFVVSWIVEIQLENAQFEYITRTRFFNADGSPRESMTLSEGSVTAVSEDAAVKIDSADLLANDTDINGDELSITDVSGVSANGASVTLNGDGTISYDPTGSATIQALSVDETLNDTFTYTTSDGNGGTDTATVSIRVRGQNDAPVAGDALTNQTADEGSAFAYSLPVDAFSDVDGDELTLAATLDDDTELPNWLMFDPDTGAFSGTPGQDDVGELTVKVTATDPSGDTAVQTFTLTIGATNDAPVSTADAYSTDEDTALVVPAVGVLVNDSDADDDNLSAVLVSDVANGTLVLNDDGSFTYTPNADFTGADSFTYKANDGTTDGNTVTVDITVNAVNDAPVGAMSDLDVEVGVPLQIDLNDYFSDAESDALTYSIAGAGAAVASLEGSVLTIAFDEPGKHALIITANDGELDSPPVEITVSSNTSEELVANDDFVSPDQLFSQIDLSGEFFSHLSLRPVSTQLSDGKIAVFWSKQLADFGGDYEYVLVGKILNSDGTTAVPEFQVTPESSSTSISYPQVLSLDDGRVMVAWSMKGNTYTNSSEIKAVIYDSSGAATNTEFVLRDSSESEPSNFKLSILDDGRILATWHEGDDLFARTVSPIGEASGPIIQFSDSEASSNVNISVLSDGGFVFTWTITADAVGGSINERWTLGQVFNADGSSRTSSFIVNDTSIERVYDTRIIGLDNGEFMAVYDTGHTANSSGPIKARIFDADANELVSEFTIVEYEDGSQNFNSWARLENGNIVLAWARVDDNRSGSPYNAELAVYDVNGNRVSPVIPVDEFNSFRGENPSIAALSDGGFAVTYENTWPFNTSAAIRFFDADGTPRGGVYEDDVQIFGVDELLSNDELPANNAVELVSVDNVSSNGAEITLNDNGTITYDPTNAIDIQATRGGVIATDSFSYTIESSNGETSTAIVYLELAGLNDAPEQLLVPTIVGSDETLIPDALLKALIFDVDSEGLRIASVEADQGTLYQSEFNRDWILELPESVQTPVTITYVVWDGHGGETTATLVVDRNFSPELNSAPSVPDDITVVFGEEDYVKFDLRDFVTDADGDPLQFHVEFNSSSIWNYFWEGDLWRDDESHMFEQYDPLPLNSLKANETGNLVFDFIVTDGLETSNGQVTIVFEGENDAPYLRVSSWQPYGTWRGQAFTVTEEDLLSYVKDPDGDVLTLTSAPTMEGAEVTENQDGSWTIQIGEDYWYTSNNHKLAFSVADEHGASGVFEVSRFLSGRPAPTDFVVEAERMTQDGFLDESSYPIASGDRVARLTGSQDQESGTLSYIFSKTPATYDLVLTAFDQYGGAGTIEVRINGELLGTLMLDQNNNSQSYTVTAPNLTTLTIAGLELDYDDVIEITGYSDGEDLVHIDKLDFFVVTDPSTSSSDTIGPKADIAASAYELPGTEFDNSAPSVLVQTTPEPPVENPRSEVPELTDNLVMPIEDAASDDQLFLF